MNHYAKPPPPLRVAYRIHEQVLKHHTHDTDHLEYLLGNLTDPLTNLLTIRKRLCLCQQHNFQLARTRVLEELRCSLARLAGDIGQLEHRIPVDRPVLPLAEIAQELQQLEEEFGSWRFDRGDSTLAVITEPIELEDVLLGPFEIRLDLTNLGRNAGSSAYTVVALEPNCPTSKDNVTHPHVSDEHLCEGDAAAPIKAALLQGRICDFFILVRSVLQTYNRDSPYVTLESWKGLPCHDCGYVVDDDDRYYCESCDHDYCSECISSCCGCDRISCSGCLEECAFCSDCVCSSCMGTCNTCSKPCCESCLEEELCPECFEKQDQQMEKNHDQSQELQPSPGETCNIPVSPAAHGAHLGQRARRRARHQAA